MHYTELEWLAGTAQDVSFLIDHVPAYLYPSGERTIAEWGMSGISLGGHSTWIALTRGMNYSLRMTLYMSISLTPSVTEPRLNIAIPIIGCPDYVKLISQRAQLSGLPFAPPHYPPQLKAYVDAYDPASFPFRTKDGPNPFLGRKILVLSGAKDTLVPWTASKEFIDGLEVGDGEKQIFLEENAGHECTPVMVQKAAVFVGEWLAN